jgi:hypothetical protein
MGDLSSKTIEEMTRAELEALIASGGVSSDPSSAPTTDRSAMSEALTPVPMPQAPLPDSVGGLQQIIDAGGVRSDKGPPKYINTGTNNAAGVDDTIQTQSPNMFSGVSSASNRGMTLGLSDPIAAFARAGVDTVWDGVTGADNPQSFGDRYDDHRNIIQSDAEAFRRENPITDIVAEGLGGLGALGGAGMGVKGARAVSPSASAAMERMSRGRVLPSVPGAGAAASNVSRGKTLATRSAKAAGVGSAATGFYEMNTSRPGEALNDALDGLLLGGVIGAGSVPVIELGLGLGRGVFNKIADKFGGDVTEAGRRIAAVVKEAGEGDLQRGIERVKRRLKTFGPGTVLADVLGERGVDMASGAALVPGKSRQQAADFVSGRKKDRPKRLRAVADENLSDESFYDNKDEIVESMRKEAEPLYKAAFAPKTTKGGRVVVQWDEHLERMINDPDMKRGMAQGIKIIRRDANADNIPFNYEEYAIKGFNEDGTLIFGGTPNLRVLDAGKRGLDQIIEAARDDFGKIKWTPDLRSIENFRKKLVAKLDDMTTDEDGVSLYKKARAEWAGPAQQVDSMKMGRRFMKGDEEVSKKVFDAMTPDNQSQFLLGVRREVTQFINSNTETAVNKFGDNKADLWIRFENLLPAEKFKAFKSSIDIEIKKAQNEKLINPNYGSPTERNRQNVENLSRAPGFLTEFLDSGATAGKSGMISALARGGKDWLKRPSKKVAGELLDTLLEMDPSKQSALLDAIGTGTAMDKFAPFLSKDRAAQLASIVAAKTPTMIQSLLRDKEEIEGQRGSRLERKPMKNALGAN